MIKDDEKRKTYMRAKDSQVIHLRLNAKEKTLLDIDMKNEEWDNISGYIKYKLFGTDVEEKISKLIKKKQPEEIIQLLINELKQLNSLLVFLTFRYDKDMRQLYREEGVNPKEWIDATRPVFLKATAGLKDIFHSNIEIAKALGIEISHQHFMPDPKTDVWNDSEAWDRLAKEMWESYQFNATGDLGRKDI